MGNPKGTARRRWRLGTACVLVVGGAAAGCAEPLDTTRQAPVRGSLGEEVYRVLCERLAAEHDPTDVDGSGSLALCRGDAPPASAPSPRLRALAERRDVIVGALDRAIPEETEDDLDRALVRMLPLYDPPAERLPAAAEALGKTLAAVIADDDALTAIERVASRRGYRPLRQALGLARPLLAYPRFDAFAATTLRALTADDRAGAAFRDLVRVSGAALAASQVDPDAADPTSTFRLTRDLLFTPSTVLSAPHPNPIVRRDPRGLVMVRRTTAGLPAPFVDENADGLPDADRLGRFVDAMGAPMDVPTPFPTRADDPTPRDALGVALTAGGTPLYETFDANQTVLAGLTRELRTFADPSAPALLEMAKGLPTLLGPWTPQHASFGHTTVPFTGLSVDQSPALDLVHGVGALLEDESADDLLAVLDLLLSEHEPVVAGLARAGLDIDTYAAGSDAALVEGSTLWDDVLLAAEWMAAEPGLTEAVLRALADPYAARLGPIVADFARHRDFVAPYAFAPNLPLEDVEFEARVDRVAGNHHANQSILQRVIALIHDFDQASHCNRADAQVGITLPLKGPVTLPLRFAECELVRIDNMAKVFAQSILGRAELEVSGEGAKRLVSAANSLGIQSLTVDELFARESTIDGLDTSPTPMALSRMAFLPPNRFLRDLFPAVLTRDGVPVSPRHDATLFACERKYAFTDGRFPARASFYDAISPFLRAFDDHDRGLYGAHIGGGAPSERFLFGEFVSALHRHWPGPDSDFTQSHDPGAPNYAQHDAAHRYEDILAYAVDQADLIGRLHVLAVTLDGMELRPGVDGIDALAAGLEASLRPIARDGLSARDGSATTLTNDGRTERATLRIHLLLDALNAMDGRFEGDPAALGHWRAGRSALVDGLFGTRLVDGTSVFANPRAMELLREVLRFTRGRLGAHPHGADRRAWAKGLADRLGTTLADPVLASTLRLVDAIQSSPESTREFAALLHHLGSAEVDEAAFDATVAATVDLFQLLEDEQTSVPLLRAASRLLDPSAAEAVRDGQHLDGTDAGVAARTVELLADLSTLDTDHALLGVLRNLLAADPATGVSDFERLLDALVEVHRVSPGAETTLSRDDYRTLFGRSAEMLASPEHGLARLADVIQSRRRGPGD